jgi:hypothetical protein
MKLVKLEGVGNANFSNMEILDGDQHKLKDITGNVAERDIVQFVPFRDFDNNPFKLREEVLKEIPFQVTDYYKRKGIRPQKGKP